MCDYFILTKPNDFDIGNDEKNQVIMFNQNTYILPKNNITYYINNGLFEKNLNMLEVSTITGHKTLQMLKRYTHFSIDKIVKKINEK